MMNTATWTAVRPSGPALTVSWLCQIVTAVIFLQTLYFKFTFAPETQIIFAELGGRPAATAAGVMELLCVILLLVPRAAVLGALLSLAVIGGAIASHLFVVGIAVVDPTTGESDGGLLFGLGLLVAALSTVVLILRLRELSTLTEVWRRR